MSTPATSKDEMRRRAEIREKNAELRRIDAARAMEAQRSAQAAEQAKTARLRALRLAKLAEEAEEKAAGARKPSRKKKAAAKV
ncbi:MAG TPA: hypothetical protein VIB38_10740 [Aestuariivirgaceae bacterium]|jgi:hypothetical protein